MVKLFHTRTDPSIKYHIYDPNDPDKTYWTKLLNESSEIDIFFQPEFLKLWENAFGYKSQLLVYGKTNNYVGFPFLIKRTVIPYFYTIFSEFAGPFINVQQRDYTEELIKGFIKALRSYCKQNRIVNVNVEFNPFLPHIKPFVKYQYAKLWGKIIYVDLLKDKQIIWKNLHRDKRRGIRRAREKGLTFKRLTLHDLNSFYSLYTKRMTEINALTIFPLKFFENVFSLLGKNAILLGVNFRKKLIAGSLLLGSSNKRVVYCYLMGSLQKYFKFHPIEFLFYESFLWAKEQGYQIYNLHGGLSGVQDSLYRFKKNFSPLTKNVYHLKKSFSPLIVKLPYEAIRMVNKNSIASKVYQKWDKYHL